MTRRKQTNPRPVLAFDKPEGSTGGDNGFDPGPTVTEELEEERSQDSDYDEFAPLVVDTSRLEDSSDNQEQSLPQSPLNSITSNNEVKSFTAEPTPDVSPDNSILDSDLSISPSLKSESDPSIANDPASFSSKSAARRGIKTEGDSPGNEDDYDDEDGIYLDELDDIDELATKILPVATEDGESKFICPVCNEALSTLPELTKHIRSHNSTVSGTTNTCKICGKILSSQSSLDRHMLVHSGERPFKCRVCKMSFTTNGNMHRHSRIHTKEENLSALGMRLANRRGKAAWRHRINTYLGQNGTPESNPLNSQFSSPSPAPDLLNSVSHSPAFMTRPMDNPAHFIPGMKRHFAALESNSDWMMPPFKKHINHERETTHVTPPKYEYQILPSKDEDGVGKTKETAQEGGDKDSVLHCPVCPKTFLCKYGLETHLETHPNYAVHCNLCDRTFPNPRSLRMHKMMFHTQPSTRGDEAYIKQSEGEPQENVLDIGFHDLSFVDFSVEKFSLIAKHYCEKYARSSSSAFHNFVCKTCSKAFPCETALVLHSFTHSTEKTTQCPLCECDYSSSEELHTHMLKHMSDKAFMELHGPLREVDDEAESPEKMNQPDFLAMLDLKGKEEHSEVKEESSSKTPQSKPVKMEKLINNDYFPKLGHAFSPHLPPIPPYFNHIPFFRQAGSATLDDFHKMLEIATANHMNMLPSLNAPLNHKLSQDSSIISPHASPSKLPFNFPPHVNIPSSPYSSMNHTRDSSSHSASPSPTPSNSDSSSVGIPELHDIKANSNGQFPCKMCDTVFNNYRSLKSHIRTHLGLSPYKCNLCSYSSADKSTLIRHLRTHNGERPFQCRVCDFAFTTKANCERHVRKKHNIEDKDEVEKAIGYNKFVVDSSSSLDNFHSPDTVCKYCGVDFKFFRALKHHLRSHSSCRQKPFQCQICEIGFSTKANCVRHFQKQHLEVPQNNIEHFITVNEPLLSEDGDQSQGESVSDDGSPVYDGDRNIPTPLSGMDSSTPQPPAAHSTPKLSGYSSDHSRHTTPSPMPIIKQEPRDTYEQPLDFSCKPTVEPVTKKEPLIDTPKAAPKSSDDMPMDLSVKKTTSPTPILPKPPASSQGVLGLTSGHHAFNKSSGDLFNCLYCPMGYSSISILERHMKHHHGHGAGTDNPVLSSQLTGLPPFSGTADGNLRLPVKPPLMISPFQYLPSKGIFHARPIRPKGRSPTLQSLQDKINRKREMARSPNAVGYDDLASINKMLDATDTHNFEGFFKSQGIAEPQALRVNHDKSSLSSSISSSMIDRKQTPLSGKLDPQAAIHRELEILEKEGDVDEEALAQVREMALSVKEDCSTNVVNPRREPLKEKTRETMGDNPDIPVSNAVAEAVSEDMDSADSSQDGQKLDDKTPPIKKKRNSYADSPHKLSCPYCPRSFPWVSSLTRHLLTHTGQKPFKCPRCPVTFSTKSNRERHLIRKHGVNMLDPMSRQTMDRPYKCPLCVFSSFSTQSNLIKHFKERHAGASLPDNMAEMAQEAAKLGLVEGDDEMQNTDGNSSMGDIAEEEEMDDDLDAEESRLEIDTKMDEDSLDSEPPKLERQASIQSNEGQGQSEPLPLQKETPSPVEMKLPVETKIEERLEPNRIPIQQPLMLETKIPIATRILQMTEPGLKLPLEMPTELSKGRRTPVDKHINPERDNYNVDKITECWKCHEKFPSRKILVRHLKEHNVDLPFKCYLCDASYDQRRDCLEHQAKRHSDDWIILQDKNKVENIEQFAIHMDKVVENNCNKLDQGTLLEIPGQGPDESKMEIVSADYMQRKVYCSLCPKRFWSLQDLRRHMRSHTGERPFECDLCQKRFTLKHSMMRHRKKHAGGKLDTYTPSDDEESTAGDDNGKSSKSSTLTVPHLPPLTRPPVFPMSMMGLSSGLSHLPMTTSSLSSRFSPSPSSSPSVSSMNTSPSGESLRDSRGKYGGAPLLPKGTSTSPVTAVTGSPVLSSSAKDLLANSDILQNLLGVEKSAIDKMLDSADSAAQFLGVK